MKGGAKKTYAPATGNASNPPANNPPQQPAKKTGGIIMRGTHRGIVNLVKQGKYQPAPSNPQTSTGPTSTPTPPIVVQSIYNWAVLVDTQIPQKAEVSPFTGLPMPAGTAIRAMANGDNVDIANHVFGFMKNTLIR